MSAVFFLHEGQKNWQLYGTVTAVQGCIWGAFLAGRQVLARFLIAEIYDILPPTDESLSGWILADGYRETWVPVVKDQQYVVATRVDVNTPWSNQQEPNGLGIIVTEKYAISYPSVDFLTEFEKMYSKFTIVNTNTWTGTNTPLTQAP